MINRAYMHKTCTACKRSFRVTRQNYTKQSLCPACYKPWKKAVNREYARISNLRKRGELPPAEPRPTPQGFAAIQVNKAPEADLRVSGYAVSAPGRFWQ